VIVQKIERSVRILINNQETVAVKRSTIKSNTIGLPHLLTRISAAGKKAVSIGIDLSGSETHGSGICILQGNDAFLSLLMTDEEIVRAVSVAGPGVIAIDSSLGLPKGRCCTEDSCSCRRFGIMRECERELRRRGVHVYPCLIPSMQKLTRRGMNIAKIFRDSGFSVIESYPGATQDILGFPRKRTHLGELAVDLMSMGITPHSDREPVTHDQIDALTNAVNGYFYLAGMYEAIGNEEEGFLILPRPEQPGTDE
jgi:predicted nuclease with RNAse H fold